MIVAGVMSGTSADGIDVAIARIHGRDEHIRFELLHHHAVAYPAAVRKFILEHMNAGQASVADMARLNFLLAERYADAIAKARRAAKVEKLELIGCHGQTLYHQGEPKKFLIADIACTWQTGDGSLLAARTGVPVVCDFRPADMAAGGQGAPLVPFLDYILFRHRSRGRIAQNIGGIANLTAIPAAATSKDVHAFDTGPGNMVLDALMRHYFKKDFDRNGAVAARGKALEAVLAKTLRHRFFAQKPPKTAGREEFGREFVAWFIKECGRTKPEDIVATATALTARSIATSIERFVLTKEANYRELIVSGGGAHNKVLMQSLAKELKPLGLKLMQSEEFGVPSAAKEALAFAVLAYQTWQRRPSNIISATGAKRPAILGKICFV